MEAIETTTIEQDGHTYRISIFRDPDAPNPLDDWSEMGTILSLNRRHVNFDPAGVEEAIEHNPDAVPLSYFEHGRCLLVGRRGIARRRAARGIRSASPGSGCPTPRRCNRPATTAAGHASTSCASVPARPAKPIPSGATATSTVTRSSESPLARVRQRGAESLDSCWGFYGLDTCRSEAASPALL